MKMTLEEYIRNPMGKDNAVYSQRSMFMDLYSQKFDAVLAREAGKINYRMYKDTESKYLIHIKIPSEVVPRFYYDVVIEFYSKDATVIASDNLNGYEIKFFSNDPFFVYTYAYSMEKNKLFIDDLAPKMSHTALTNRAKERNPKNVIGYVKSIFFAYLYIKLRGLNKKATWLTSSIKYNKKLLLADIMPADEKILLREEKGKTEAKKRKRMKEIRDTRPTSSNDLESDRFQTHKSRAVRSVSKTKVINSNHFITHTKRVKKK